jgi:hypothetical protein
MPDSEIRRAVTGTRREGRRSHSAYESSARGIRSLVCHAPRPAQARGPRRGGALRRDDPGWSAGIALALVHPFVRRALAVTEKHTAKGAPSQPIGGEGTGGMKRKPTIKSLETLSLEEAAAYLLHAAGDELDAAYALALDRNRLDGSLAAPDETEVHHALFLLRRVTGKHPPSFDEMRVELRRRLAA